MEVSFCGEGWTTPVGFDVGSLTRGVPVLSSPAGLTTGVSGLSGPVQCAEVLRKLGSTLKWVELENLMPGGNGMLRGL